MTGKIFLISGQSGVGKDTILHKLIAKHPNYYRVITYTTRKPRPREINAKDYFFINEKEFFKKVKQNEFLEYALVHNHYYGTPKDEVEKALKEGKIIFIAVDVQGAMRLKKKIPATSIFIKYESDDLENLIKRRLLNDKKRGKISQEEISRRIQSAKKEAFYQKYYDYIVVNPEGKIEKALSEIEKIVGC